MRVSRRRVLFASASVAAHFTIVVLIFLALPRHRAVETQKPVIVMLLPPGHPAPQPPEKKHDEQSDETPKPKAKVKLKKAPVRLAPPPDVPGYLSLIWSRLCIDIDPVTEANLGMPSCVAVALDEPERAFARAHQAERDAAVASRHGWKSQKDDLEQREKMAPVDTCAGAETLCGSRRQAP